jgi:hypothetical protein
MAMSQRLGCLGCGWLVTTTFYAEGLGWAQRVLLLGTPVVVQQLPRAGK